jgi:hypothetical protein
MILQIFKPSLNAAELRETNSLERYLIIFRTGQVSKICMHSSFLFYIFLNSYCFYIARLFERIIHGYFSLDRMIQGSGLSGPIPSGISLLRNLTDLYV